MRFMISTVVSAVQVYASGVINFEEARPPFLLVTSPIKMARPFFLFSSSGPGGKKWVDAFRIFFATRLYSNGPIRRIKRMELMVSSGKAKYVSIFGIPVL